MAGTSRIELELSGATALVTGAASGIGLATTRMLGAAGVRVLAVDVATGLEDSVRDLVTAGCDVVAVRHDITDEEGLVAALEAAGADGLAYVANCAGIHQQRSFDDITLDEWRRMLEVNLLGAFAVTRAAARWLRASGGGAVVNVTSTEAERVIALVNPDAVPHYAASKAALAMLTRSEAHALAADGIRVNAVAPGFVATPMTRGNHDASDLPEPARARALIQRYAEPEEIAVAVCFLLSDGAGFITGTTLHVDGGYLVT